MLQGYKDRYTTGRNSRIQPTQPTSTCSTWTWSTSAPNSSTMPKSLSSLLISLKLNGPRRKEQQTHTSSMQTSTSNQPQQPSSSYANLPYWTSLELRSRPRNNTFGIEKKREKGSSWPIPKGSEKLGDASDKTETMSTNSETSSVT
jgi:hypothetical protein